MTDSSEKWFLPIKGDEHILLGRTSSLREIPVNIEPKTAVFLDGIRHAIEVMDIGFGRLRIGLTKAALDPPNSTDLPLVCAGIFLDAWAVVDAIDRFRQLYTQFPGMTRSKPSDDVPPLDQVLQVFRDLRNVTDHLAQRADVIVAKGGGAAFGELTWLTGFEISPRITAWHCVLRPGTLRSEPTPSLPPTETTLDWPTDCICLKAGGYLGNLSQVRFHIAGRIRHLESQITKAFSRSPQNNAPIFNDFFSRRPVVPATQKSQTTER